MECKRLVLDANILIRGCLGVRVRTLIADYAPRQADLNSASQKSGHGAALSCGMAPQALEQLRRQLEGQLGPLAIPCHGIPRQFLGMVPQLQGGR